jgi:ABC-type transport system substrate-binding protein
MFFEGWVNLLATPEDGLFPLFYNGNLGIYGNYNYYNNSTASHLLLTAGETLNATQRDSMYAQVQNMLGQAAVEIPLFNLQNVIPHTTNVHDLYVYPTFDMYFDQAYMT